MGMKLHLPFEKIYVLTLADYPERKQSFENQIKLLDIDNEINYWYSVTHPHVRMIANYLKRNGKFKWGGG